AFKSNLSRAAALTVSPKVGLNSLDTHTNHEGHHRESLTDVFRQIASVLATLDQVHLLNRTNVYITSEFSRSPSLNNSLGKEHNAFTNSALVMGPRIAGGRVIGGTKLIPKAESGRGESLHVAQYVNPETGKALPNGNHGVLLKPETV